MQHPHNHDKYVDPLKLIQNAGFTSAIIAGGAFRDLYHNIEPKDIDIFVWDPEFSDEQPEWQHTTAFTNDDDDTSIRCWRTILELDPEDSITLIYGEYSSFCARNTAVWDIWKSGINIQIIFTKTKPVDHMHRYFDIGLCKCYHDGHKVHYTDDFMTDANNKLLTIVAPYMTREEYATTMHVHVPALRKKYPHHVLVATEPAQTTPLPIPTPPNTRLT